MGWIHLKDTQMKSLPIDNKPLTAKQRAYCQARAAGFTQSAAYLKAGYNPGSPDAANKNAFALEQLPHVRAHLAQLREKAFAEDALSLAEKRSIIGKMVRSTPAEVTADSPLAQSYTEEVSPDGSVKKKVVLPDKARLLDLDNKMAGHDWKDQRDQDAVAKNPFLFIVNLGKPEFSLRQHTHKEAEARLIQ
jgi:hypothetical protein